MQLKLARSPRTHRSQVEWAFVHADELEMFETRAAYIDGELAGWASTVRGKWFPPGIAMIHVTVAQAHERQGAGGALFRAMVDDLPAEISMIGSAVDDAETDSLEVARAWGFEVTQHGIESELPLVDLPTPEAGPGVTFEDVSSLEFPDEDAVEAMLRDSQTNPEAAEGFLSTLATFREIAAKVQRPISALRAGRREACRDHRRRDPGRRPRHRLHRCRPRVPRPRAGVRAQAVRPPARRRGRCHRLPHHERGEQRRHPAHQR